MIDFDVFCDEIIVPVTNLFNVSLEINFNDFSIKIQPYGESIQESISKYWEIPQVGTIIKITKETELITNYNVTINSLILLLSLAKGRLISFCIQKQILKDKELSIIGSKFSSYKYIPEIVPDSDLHYFISKGLEIITKWTPEEILDFKTVIEYLNATDTGYLDDRIFHIMQCWEIVANRWGKVSVELPSELKCLKQKLKNILKSWHIEFPNFDLEKFWDNRIIGSLKWEKNLITLKDTLEEFCIDNNKLKIDLKKLVKHRDAVAHSGRLGNGKPVEELITAQFGLRLLLLRLFDYDKNVKDYRYNLEGNISDVDIKTFLTLKN